MSSETVGWLLILGSIVLGCGIWIVLRIVTALDRGRRVWRGWRASAEKNAKVARRKF